MVNLCAAVKLTGDVDTEGPLRRLCGEWMANFDASFKSSTPWNTGDVLALDPVTHRFVDSCP